MACSSRLRFVLRSASLLLGLFLLLAGCQPAIPESNAASETPAATAAQTITPSAEPTDAEPAEAEPTVALTDTGNITTTEVVTDSTSEVVADQPQDDRPSEDELAAGLAVYRKYYCGVCHTLDSAGTLGTFGPSHNGLGATAALRIQDPNYSGKATTPAEYIRESILDPTVYYVEGFAVTSHRMPPYTMLPEEEVDALVLFLVNQ